MDRRDLTRTVLALTCAVIAAFSTIPAVAQTPAQPAAAAAPDTRDRVVLSTAAGDIVIALEPNAPVTAANFLRYVDEHRFDGTDFYRAMVVAPGIGLIQGGTNNAPGRVLPSVVHEPTSQTGLTHNDGALSMARYGPGTANGDFFIIVGNVRSLDASPTDPGFAVFGHVIQGMDIVRQIMVAPTSPTEGEGFMRGQMLDPRIRIVSARRLAAEQVVPQP